MRWRPATAGVPERAERAAAPLSTGGATDALPVPADPAATAVGALGAHLALCTLDAEGRILAVNGPFCVLTGTEREALLGWGLDVLRMEHRSRPLVEVAWPTLQAGVTWRGEVRLVAADEREVWAETTLVPLRDETGRLAQVLLVQTDVTARKRAEAALAQLHARLHQLVRASPVILYAATPNTQLRLTYVSENVHELLGYRPETLLREGRFWERIVHPDDRASVLARLPLLFRDGRLTAEYRVRAADGAWRWFRDTLRVVRGTDGQALEIAGAMVDVTERREAEDALREREHNLRTLAEHASDAILVVRDGRHVYANRAAGALLGLDPEVLVGMRLREVVDGAERARVERLCGAELEVGRPQRYETLLRRGDGRTVPVEVTASRVVWQGEPAVALMVRDISVRRALERELRRARDEAQAAERAKTALLANLSHEIRTPLAGVIGMLELLEGERLGAGARRRIEAARGSAEHLLRLLDDLLDLSRLEAGALPVRPRPMDLVALLEAVAQSFADTAAAKGLELEWRVDPALPTWVRGDPERLRQVLVNLVANALKFTERGGVELEALPAGDGDRVRLEVRDTGPGVAPEIEARIFSPFVQGDESMSRRHGGVGLGLAIAAQIARRHGGTLGLRRRPGGGTCFALELELPPVAPPATPEKPLEGVRVHVAGDGFRRAAVEGALLRLGARIEAAPGAEDVYVGDASAPPPSRPRAVRRVGLAVNGCGVPGWDAVVRLPLLMRELVAACGGPSGSAAQTCGEEGEGEARGLRVLVVEDDPVNREVAVGMLRGLGARPRAVATAEAALEILAQERFDLVLMDCQLPGLDGYEAVRRLRAREQTTGGRRVPVVAMTAHTLEGEQARCAAAGMDAYLAKPLRRDALGRLLAALGASHAGDGRPAAAGAQTSDSAGVSDGEGRAGLVDRAQLAAMRAAVGPEVAGRALEAFLEALPERLRELGEVAARYDVEAVGRLAHTLKGSAASVGAVALAQQCGEVVQAARDGTLEHPVDTCAALEALARKTAGALERAWQEMREPSPGGRA